MERNWGSEIPQPTEAELVLVQEIIEAWEQAR